MNTVQRFKSATEGKHYIVAYRPGHEGKHKTILGIMPKLDYTLQGDPIYFGELNNGGCLLYVPTTGQLAVVFKNINELKRMLRYGGSAAFLSDDAYTLKRRLHGWEHPVEALKEIDLFITHNQERCDTLEARKTPNVYKIDNHQVQFSIAQLLYGDILEKL